MGKRVVIKRHRRWFWSWLLIKMGKILQNWSHKSNSSFSTKDAFEERESKLNKIVLKDLITKFLFPLKKNNMGGFGNIIVFSSHVLIFANMLRKSQIAFWQMFDFYPTCLEKTKHVSIFTPGCYFPQMFGFWHTCMVKGTHVWKKPHNYMF